MSTANAKTIVFDLVSRLSLGEVRTRLMEALVEMDSVGEGNPLEKAQLEKLRWEAEHYKSSAELTQLEVRRLTRPKYVEALDRVEHLEQRAIIVRDEITSLTQQRNRLRGEVENYQAELGKLKPGQKAAPRGATLATIGEVVASKAPAVAEVKEVKKAEMVAPAAVAATAP